MTDTLRERVAHLFRTMYATEADRRIAADAAIALVLEEATREAERYTIDTRSTDEIAAAIRALKEKK